MRVDLRLAVIALLTVYGIAPTHAAGPDANEASLNKAIAAAREVCLRPADYGLNIRGGIEAGGQIKIPGLLNKLFGNGISASIKDQGELSKGLPASDRAASLKDYDACALNVFSKVLAVFSLTDVASGKQILPPKNVPRFFADHGSQIGSGNVSMTLTGNGNIQIESGGGAVTVVLPTPIVARNNRELTDGISAIMRAGIQIQKRFEETDNTTEIKGLYAAWYKTADEYLSKQLDASYAAQFEVAPDTGRYLIGRSVDGGAIHSLIAGKNQVLSSIVTELRNKQAP